MSLFMASQLMTFLSRVIIGDGLVLLFLVHNHFLSLDELFRYGLLLFRVLLFFCFGLTSLVNVDFSCRLLGEVGIVYRASTSTSTYPPSVIPSLEGVWPDLTYMTYNDAGMLEVRSFSLAQM